MEQKRCLFKIKKKRVHPRAKAIQAINVHNPNLSKRFQTQTELVNFLKGDASTIRKYIKEGGLYRKQWQLKLMTKI